MKAADIAREYSITQERLNSIKAEHKPVEKYKQQKEEHLINAQGMMENGEEEDNQSDVMFEYDLSKFNQLKNN